MTRLAESYGCRIILARYSRFVYSHMYIYGTCRIRVGRIRAVYVRTNSRRHHTTAACSLEDGDRTCQLHQASATLLHEIRCRQQCYAVYSIDFASSETQPFVKTSIRSFGCCYE